jgi:hypothetical protein
VVVIGSVETMAKRAKAVHVHTVPGFNHGYTTPQDAGRTFSNAFAWAFAGDAPLPSPEGGIVLDG